ncbi:MAG: hypothetical protein IPL39_14585 [Opitutaceae bacterium]|nr:hypothetical protein [Opitutaceae bacterium]
MAKIEVAQVADILRQNITEPAIMRRCIEQMNKVTEAAAVADEAKPPSQKKQFVILVSDPDGEMPKTELAGWVLQIPEDASPLSVQERVNKATFDFNASRRGRKLPAETIGEAIENVPAKNFKDVELWVKTKTPVLVLTTDNKLPKA